MKIDFSMSATEATHELFRRMLRLGYDGMVTDNALEIIAQMPDETNITKVSDGWDCWFPVTQHAQDFRNDLCPHVAAAKAFIAWKEGMK